MSSVFKDDQMGVVFVVILVDEDDVHCDVQRTVDGGIGLSV